MQNVAVRDGVTIYYEDDYFGPPWVEPEIALLVHGSCESSRSWTQWVPVVASKFRVIRPDLPGFGKSPKPPGYDWTPEQYAADLIGFLDRLGIGRVHLIAAKYGGMISMQLAGQYPDRVSTLAIFSSPVAAPGPSFDSSMQNRLGSSASEGQVRFWTDELYAKTDPLAREGTKAAIQVSDVRGLLPHITAPALIVTVDSGKMQSVDQVRRYQELIPNSRLEVVAGDFYHVAAMEPEKCAHMTMDFINEVSVAR